MSGAHTHNMSGTHTNTHTQHYRPPHLIHRIQWTFSFLTVGTPCFKKDEEEKNSRKIKNLETVDMIKPFSPQDHL